MENKAFYNLTYGVFLLATKNGQLYNGCITNTFMQVTSNPLRGAICVLNSNFTCELIKKSGVFSISVLDKTCNFELIKRFGMESGRLTDKFKDFPFCLTDSGVPYITESVCSVFECSVVSEVYLNSHTLFIAEIKNAFTVNSTLPLTYSDYQNKIKPKTQVIKPNSESKIIGWKCKICGFTIMVQDLPEDFLCPSCSHPKDDFEPIYAPNR